MADLLATFDVGVPGENVVADTNNVGQIIEGVPVYISGHHGPCAIRGGTPTNTANIRWRVQLGISGNHFGSIYLRNNTAHGSTTSSVNFFYLLASDNSYLAYFRVKTDNALSIRLNSGAEVRAGAAGDIPVGSWFRLDWQQTGSTFNWRIFYDPDAAAASTPNLSGTVDTSAITQPAASLILGVQSNDATIIKDWSFDTVRASSTGSWMEPYVVPTIRARWYGEGLSPGTMDTNSAGPGDLTFGFVSPGTTIDNSGPTPPRIKLTQQPSTNSYISWGNSRLVTPVVEGACRIYAEFTGWNDVWSIFTTIDASSVTNWRIDVTPTGTVRLRDGTTQVAESAWTLPLNTNLRLEVIFSASLFALYVFEGTSSVVLNQISVTTLAIPQMNGVRFGNNSGSLISSPWMTDGLVLIDKPTLIGPTNPPEPGSELPVTVWDGTSEVEVSSVTLWDGTQEVPITIGFN